MMPPPNSWQACKFPIPYCACSRHQVGSSLGSKMSIVVWYQDKRRFHHHWIALCALLGQHSIRLAFCQSCLQVMSLWAETLMRTVWIPMQTKRTAQCRHGCWESDIGILNNQCRGNGDPKTDPRRGTKQGKRKEPFKKWAEEVRSVFFNVWRRHSI